jgi:hypothetical protein
MCDDLDKAFDAFSKATSMPGGPSLAMQRHDPTWEAWKTLCDTFAARRKAGVAPVEPHDYVPSTMHMGDCAVCGHLQESPNHLSRVAARRDLLQWECPTCKQWVDARYPVHTHAYLGGERDGSPSQGTTLREPRFPTRKLGDGL